MWYNQIGKWNPSSFLKSQWMWPKQYIYPLDYALQRKQSPLKDKQTDLWDTCLATLHFDGSFELRESSPVSIKGKLFKAESGDVVYSKIDVRNGAIGIVPDSMPTLAFTSEFPIYTVRNEVALPEYIKLLFRTSLFRQTINSMVSGASGRKRIQPSELESVDVPLPPPTLQKAIVQKWKDAEHQMEIATRQYEELQASSMSLIRHMLGKTTRDKKVRPKYFACNWSNIGRWGVDICWNENQSKTESLFPTVSIRDVCKMGSGGTPSRKVQAYYEGGQIPWVKTSEVLNDVITDTEEKITELGLSESAAKLYPQGSILVAMYGQGATRGRTAKLGIEATTNQACCVLYDFDDRINADYLWFYLMSEYDNLRSLASGNNQPNLNADMIGSYPVPLPPLELQGELVEKVRSVKQRAQIKKQEIDDLRKMVTAEIEAAILGMESLQVN